MGATVVPFTLGGAAGKPRRLLLPNKKGPEGPEGFWSGQRDSNPRMSAWEADALPLGDARVRRKVYPPGAHEGKRHAKPTSATGRRVAKQAQPSTRQRLAPGNRVCFASTRRTESWGTPPRPSWPPLLSWAGRGTSGPPRKPPGSLAHAFRKGRRVGCRQWQNGRERGPL